ncbi:hypothetical protein N5P37_006637 [Trichoderma harzianum]|uniref:Uncharacterized protein n=1 Tax=Trichoderma harzianum CBS 226.95 TaxID=983964 RepID=A0A2T3ZRG6_TRIHA|nr:hypothetical protein M431DRAFT_130018 [Trichoderma harzianum CBS 226.95]KAK0760443.1 hypothetical protein N5P37_006637 [Trichoderma harzianum]PKK46202.1 hypothetical protein CI102_9547 [Trichoderma harzianum]PTB47413.1 hypothetical protein M431DRAFT_130018 [Trichoderma harzianum CBS 226.95]
MFAPQSFSYNIAPSRVVFGSGKLRALPVEMARRELRSPLILTTSEQIHQGEMVKATLGTGHTFAEATMHTPTSVTERALAYAKSVLADSIVSIGGGSTIGLGKAISIRTGLPHICIPTTYSGSEMTPILGESADGLKKTRSDPKILPGTVIYDVDLTMTLPVGLSAASGMNAIAHAVEALYAHDSNPIISLLAIEGVKSLAESLPAIMDSPTDLNARSMAQYGAWLCGLCLGSVGMALHHKLCHVLGGSFNLPHAETHAVILPHSLAYNAPNIPEVMKKLADVLPGSNGDAVQGLSFLLKRLKLQRGLQSFGFKDEDIDKAADIATSNPYSNPRPVERPLIRELIRRAYAGEDARVDM